MARNKPSCVLVTRFSALGDVALALPVVYDACRANPDVRFVLASRPWITGLAQQKPDNLTVVAVDLKNKYRGLRGMARLAAEMRREYGVDAHADLHSVMRTWAIGAALRMRGVTVRRIDKGRREKRALINHRLRQPLKHTTERYRDVFARLGLEAPRTFTTLFPDALPPCVIAGDKKPGERWIAVGPFSAHRGKVYPLEQMREVVNQIASDNDTRVFLMGGGAEEKAILHQWADDSGNITSVADIDHTFADELALLARCDAMVSMDSANMHLASLVKLPVVSIWGATHPHCGFMGYGQSDDNAIQLDLPCRPCSVFGEKECQHNGYRCLTGITPQQILAKVNQITKK